MLEPFGNLTFLNRFPKGSSILLSMAWTSATHKLSLQVLTFFMSYLRKTRLPCRGKLFFKYFIEQDNGVGKPGGKLFCGLVV